MERSEISFKDAHKISIGVISGISAGAALGMHKYARKMQSMIESRDKVKFILYLCTNYPRRNYNRVCEKMRDKNLVEWNNLLNYYKKKYKVQV